MDAQALGQFRLKQVKLDAVFSDMVSDDVGRVGEALERYRIGRIRLTQGLDLQVTKWQRMIQQVLLICSYLAHLLTKYVD